ncbi:acyl-CoA dehydrogenase family protein [Emcibacter sp. SYSU 3D8]|uniref:acyl-CoA dehydrogenase family protein n=1 Tax=Emcibacter sp. SYSU 3D8 TaxID=3133969 RepID=UPI0031FEC500
MRTLILDTAERIFRDICDQTLVDKAEKGEWPAGLWQTLEESGLTQAAVPEEQGGAGGTIGDGLYFLKASGRYVAPLPLAETLIAGVLLAEAGAQVPAGPLTIAPVRPNEIIEFSDGKLSGTATRVPFAQGASAIVVATSAGLAIVDPASVTIERDKSMAGEPRDTVIFDGAPATIVGNASPDRIWQLGALARSVQMAGALEGILAMSVQYVQDRKQFGRALSKFQAVQQSLAAMAGQVAAASSAADVAIEATEAGDPGVSIAVAKARVGEAAGIAAELAHQAHGAIGFTHEYALHQFTRRLWAWRDEFGGEPYWQAEIGRLVAKSGADNLWKFASRT